MLRLRGLFVFFALVCLLGGGLLHGQDSITAAKLKGYLPPNYGKLGLSDEQKQKVYKIQGDYNQKTADLEKQLKALKEQEKSDLLKVLSEGQKAKLKELLIGKELDK